MGKGGGEAEDGPAIVDDGPGFTAKGGTDSDIQGWSAINAGAASTVGGGKSGRPGSSRAGVPKSNNRVSEYARIHFRKLADII